MFVFPAVALGFMAAFPVIYGLFYLMFGSSLGYMPSIIPSANSVGIALFIGMLIPLLSSIIPIKRALSVNLTDSLNVSRSKSQGVLITFIDKKTKDIVPYLVLGSVAVVFGIGIYYGLPVALL